MFNGKPVIDCHGHMSTPPQFRAYAYNLIALRTPGDELLSHRAADEGPARPPPADARQPQHRRADDLAASGRDDALGAPVSGQSVDASRPTTSSRSSASIWGDRFVGIAQLLQTPEPLDRRQLRARTRTLRRDGFRRSDPSTPIPAPTGSRPGMNDQYWFPLYKMAEELDMTLIVHPSISKDPRFEIIALDYQFNNIIEETSRRCCSNRATSSTQFPETAHRDLPLRRRAQPSPGQRPAGRLRRAGARSRQHRDRQRRGNRRQVGIDRVKKERKKMRDLTNNLFFDTCCYDPHFLGAAIKQRGVDQMVFGTEVPGSGSDIFNPQTNKPRRRRARDDRQLRLPHHRRQNGDHLR